MATKTCTDCGKAHYDPRYFRCVDCGVALPPGCDE